MAFSSRLCPTSVRLAGPPYRHDDKAVGLFLSKLCFCFCTSDKSGLRKVRGSSWLSKNPNSICLHPFSGACCRIYKRHYWVDEKNTRHTIELLHKVFDSRKGLCEHFG